jgi:peptidoglycan/LPS O-acetylase OafA/YrhL
MTPQHHPTTGENFPVLDGLRGVAVISVVIFHTAFFNPYSNFQNVLHSLCKAGWLGVPIFFVLSGFLISYTLFKQADRFDPYDYLVKRAAKILPPFVLSLLVLGVIYQFAFRREGVLTSALAHLSTLAHFTTGWTEINPVYWSLMIEIHFYILLPLVFFVFRTLCKRPEWATLGFFVLVPMGLRLATHLPSSAPTQQWLLNAHMLPKAMDNFSFGILFAIICRHRNQLGKLQQASRILAPLGVLLMAACYLSYAFLQWRWAPLGGFYGLTSVPVFETYKYLPSLATFLLLFCIFLPATHPLSRCLNLKPLALSGVISYEWFLLHYPPVLILGKLLGSPSGNIGIYLLRTVFPFILCFGLSYLIWRYFSDPILKASKSYLRARTTTRLSGSRP